MRHNDIAGICDNLSAVSRCRDRQSGHAHLARACVEVLGRLIEESLDHSSGDNTLPMHYGWKCPFIPEREMFLTGILLKIDGKRGEIPLFETGGRFRDGGKRASRRCLYPAPQRGIDLARPCSATMAIAGGCMVPRPLQGVEFIAHTAMASKHGYI